MLRRWKNLPENMRNDAVKPYYEALKKKQLSIAVKRGFDLVAGLLSLIVLSPIMLVIGAWIRLDSKGPALYRQVRVTRYSKPFRIFKFRTMRTDADRMGSQMTVDGDSRITRAGSMLRARRLDELPQLLNIVRGEMSFVGARPEVPKYVDTYTDEMMAVFLLPAGVTSDCSLLYRDEGKLLKDVKDVDGFYIHELLPQKMRCSLDALMHFGLADDMRVMWRTVRSVIFGKAGNDNG